MLKCYQIPLKSSLYKSPDIHLTPNFELSIGAICLSNKASSVLFFLLLGKLVYKNSKISVLISDCFNSVIVYKATPCPWKNKVASKETIFLKV